MPGPNHLDMTELWAVYTGPLSSRWPDDDYCAEQLMGFFEACRVHDEEPSEVMLRLYAVLTGDGAA